MIKFMAPLLIIPIVVSLFILLFIEMSILAFPLVILKLLTGKDFSRPWMIAWFEIFWY